MSEAMWKDSMGTQPADAISDYAEAINKFSTSATGFIEHIHRITEARTAYQDAVAAGTALRDRLDAGDQTMRSLMTQLEQIIKDHFDDKHLDRKKARMFP